jgi:hypothetical protein
MLTAPMAPLAASVNSAAAARAEQRALANGVKKQLTAHEVPVRSSFVNPLVLGVPQPNISATLTDSFIDTSPADGRADPGSIVTYTAVIKNTGASATGVNFIDTISPYTTLIGGSINSSPRATVDSYNATQDTVLDTAAASLPTVVANDAGTPAPTVGGVVGCADVTAPFTCNTTQVGGSVTLNTDGSFTYTPPTGFTGTDDFTYTATNGLAPDDTAKVTLTVGCGAITVNNPPTNSGTVNSPFSQTFTQTGGVGTTNFTLNSGTLPTGLTLHTSGVLDGTPTVTGSFPITVKATDSNGCVGVGPTYTLTINQPPTITSANNVTFKVGAPGSFTVTTTGFPTNASMAISESGALPGGVTLVNNNDGTATLAGTPNAGTGGTYPITITANNGVAPNATQNFTLTVQQAPAVTSANGATFQTGVAGTFTVTTTGFPTAASMVITKTGTLPANVTFTNNNDGTATIAGTPAATTGGTYPITITANNGVTPNATQNFTLTVNQPPAITSANNVTFKVGTAGTFSVTTTGFPTNASMAISESGALPGGVTLVNNNNGTATLAGTPDPGTGGTYPITITANNGVAPDGTQSFTLTVQQAPALTSTNAATFQTGVAGTFTVTTTGFPTAASMVITKTGTLPANVTFTNNNDGTATIAGTPAAATGGTYAITITANNGVTPNATQNFTLTVNQPPAITSGNNVTFKVGTAGTFNVTTTGFPTNASMAISESGALPSGVTLVNNNNGTATLAGTPDPGTGGTYPITITANNGVAPNATQNFTLTIQQAPAVTSANAATFQTGVAGTFTVTTTGFPTGASMVITKTGTLPANVTFTDNNDGTATIAGTPTAATGGTYPITITANNGVTPNATQNFTLTVNQPPQITSANTDTFAPGKTGQVFNVTATGFPNNALMVFSATGTFPTGVSLTDNGNGTAKISGTPAAGTQSGSPYSTIVLKASNGVSPDSTQNFTLNIVCPVITVSGTTPLNLTHNVAMSTSNYSQSGGNGTITWSAAGLPTGVSINSATGDVTGTPSVTGTFSVTITATDAGGCTGTKSITVNVVPNLQSQGYTGVGNTQFFITGVAGAPTTPAVSSANGLLTGATPAGNVTVTGASCSVGGTLTAVDATGHFIFTPNVSATSATCTYTASSNTGVGSTGPASATANLTFTLNNRVWYVNSSGANGDGRSNNPFNTMNGADTSSGAGDYVFVHTGGATTTGNISLAANQTLWGQGSTFTLGGLTIASGGKPLLTGTVTLGGNNDTVSSLDISSAGATGITNSATITGALVTNNVTVTTTTGAGVSFNNVTGTFTFTALTTAGGAGASLTGTNTGSTFTFSNVNVTGSGSNVGLVATGGGTITVTGTGNIISTATGTALNVSNTTIAAGGLTFQSISANGAANGIILNNTGANAGLTVNGTGSAGTGGTIQNISTRGASFISARNISLNWMNFTNANTTNGAASDGTVGGNENTDENGAIHLATAVNVALSNIVISGTTVQHGINGNNVTNLDLTNVSISNTGDAVWESGIYLFHLKGLASASQDSVWSNVDITDTAQFNVSIINASGTNAAGGEKDKLTIQNGSSFKNSGKNVIGDHISIFNSVTANFQVVVNAATFDSKINGEYAGAHTSDGIQVDVSGSSARSDATITGCTFTSTTGGGAGQSAINISSTTGAGTFDVENNIATLRQGVGINVAVTGTASLTGTIKGNTLSTNITNNPGFGIALVEEGNGSIVANIENNTIQGTDGAINTVADFDYGIKAGARAGSGSAQLTLKGNTIQSAKSAGVWLFAGNNTGGETNTTCVNFSTAVKNSIHANPATRFDDYFLEQYTNTTFNIQGLSGSGTNAANVNSYVASTDAVAGRVVSSSLGTVVNYTNATCTTAPLMLAGGGIEAALPPCVDGAATTAAAPNVLTPNSLTQQQLDSIVAEAIERWSATGLTATQVETLHALIFELADLEGAYLGEAGNNQIQIDRQASGKGWFVDATPREDSEFASVTSTTRRYTDPLSAPAGHVDLLTTIEHEMGHKLGLPDTYAERDRDNLMYGYLTVGERRLPAPGQARNAKPGQTTQHLKLRSASAVSRRAGTVTRLSDTPVTPLSGETVHVIIGTLGAGKSVTITFQVMLNTAMPAGTSTITTQGTVSYDSGPGAIVNSDGASNGLGPDATVLTDDPGVGTNSPGETDPTVTPIDAPTAAGSNIGGQILDSNGNPVEGAGIRMSGAQNRLTVTDAQGFYHFDNVETGGFYTVSATRANFSFSPSSRSFSALGQHTDAAFSASPTGSTLNPLDTTEYFVRQQYVDFLNREPDEAGLNFWYNNIEGCGNDAQCRAGKRTDTSAAFFLSIEFQQTGYLVYKSYQAAYGDLPGMPVPVRLSEFKPDTQEIGNGVIVNAPGWETTLNTNKLAFMAEFVQRQRFASAYAPSLTPTEFVNRLFANAGVTPADSDRTAAIGEFGSAGTSADVAARGRALQRVAENSMLTQQEFTQAFVLIQYFGYLRRDPNTGPDTDFSGYNFWLQKLNTFNGNFGRAEMVKSFLVSGEYRGRFPR